MHPSATPISSLPSGHQDLARAIVDGLLAGRPVIAVIDVPGIASKPVIDAALSALEEQQTRIVRVEENSISVLGPPISAMDQLSEFAAADAESTNGRNASPDLVAQIKRGLRVLGYRPFGERRRLLVVESVQFVPPETLEQLARLTIAGPPELPMQMLFVGDATYWHGLQAAKFEDARQRIGVPLIVLPATGSGEATVATAPASDTRSVNKRRTTGARRSGRALALIILVGIVFVVLGILLADSDLRHEVFPQILTLWTALGERVHRLIGWTIGLFGVRGSGENANH